MPARDTIRLASQLLSSYLPPVSNYCQHVCWPLTSLSYEPMRYACLQTQHSDRLLQSQSTLQLSHIAIDPCWDPCPSLSYSYPMRYAFLGNELLSADCWHNLTSVGSQSWSLTKVYGQSTLRGPPAVGWKERNPSLTHQSCSLLLPTFTRYVGVHMLIARAD